jgi:hypothetical protein
VIGVVADLYGLRFAFALAAVLCLAVFVFMAPGRKRMAKALEERQ